MNKGRFFSGGYGNYPQQLPEEVLAALKAADAKQRKPAILGMAHVGSLEKGRKIINSNGLSPEQQKGICHLYDELVRDPNIRATRPVDVGLIAQDGFAAFECSIGYENWDKVKKYYGIGCKADTSCLDTEELEAHLTNMRTIENACAYIAGYWEVVKELHGCLDKYNPTDGVDERHQILTGAKMAVFAVEVLCGEWFLHKQMKRNASSTKNRLAPDWLPDYKLCHKKANLQQPYGPEDVIGVYEMLKPYGPKCISVDMVMREVWNLQQRDLIEEAMAFCELTFTEEGSDWDIISNNTPNPYNTIAKAMELKKRVHPVRSVRAMEAFILYPFMMKTSQTELWELYGILSSSFDKEDKILKGDITSIDGGYFYAENIRERIEIFALNGKHLISGPIEAERILHFCQYVYLNDFELPYFEQNKEHRGPAGQVMVAITILHRLGCTKAFVTRKAMVFAQEILKMDRTGILADCLKRFVNNEAERPLEEIVKELGITSVELERWGGEEPTDWSDHESVTKWLIKWANKKGYVVQNDPEQRLLISAIIVEGNIDKIKAFAMKELDEETFMQKIGFDPEFAYMYFARNQVECDVLTNHLIKAAKQAKRQKKTVNASTANLYNYLVNHKIECGPDLTVMRQDSALKKLLQAK